MTRRAAAVGVAIVLHVVLVASVWRQPLNAGIGPMSDRYLLASWSHDSTRMNGPGIDFFAVYHAGFNQSKGMSIYRVLELSTGRTPYFFEFRYLPIVAMTLGRVVCLLPPLTAYRLWILLLEVVMWTVMLTVFRRLLRTWPGTVAWIALALSTPYMLELHMGQFTFAASGLMAIGVWWLDRAGRGLPPSPRRWWAAAAIAAGSLLKLFPVVALVPCARRRQWWGVAAAAALAIGVLTVPMFLDRPDDWYNFLDANRLADPGPGNFGLQYALFLTIQLFGVPWSGELWIAMIKIGLFVVMGIAIPAVLFSRRRSYLAEVGLLLMAQSLASFQIWEHHMTGVMIAGGLLLVAMLESGGGQVMQGASLRMTRSAWVIAGALVLIALPTPYAFMDPNPKFWTAAGRMALQWVKPLPTLVMFVCGLAWLLADGVELPSRLRGRQAAAASSSARASSR